MLQPNALLRRLYPRALWNIPTEEKIIYLTFDDGPIPGLTEWVLDELKKFNAKATFFCVGDNILKHPEVFRRVQSEGHTTANHTMHHSKGFRTSVYSYLHETNACRRLVENNYFRPPYGQLKRGQYKALLDNGYQLVMWDVISYDYEKIEAERCARNVIRNAGAGSIVLFHDNIKAEKNLRHALPATLKHFSELGFRFEALSATA